MPELPEVETTRRGLDAILCGRTLVELKFHTPKLRYPLERRTMKRLLRGRSIMRVDRRAKYLMIVTQGPAILLCHLGMSGRFLVTDVSESPRHTHAEFFLDDGRILRYIDPRRFGLLAAVKKSELESHPLLARLGPEPLSDAFDNESFHHACRRSRRAIKQHIMDARVVVGVGNIYASEALFRAGIHPMRAACRLSRQRTDELNVCIRRVLTEAIRTGGTTLRDFLDPEEQAGYFAIELNVYGREAEPCKRCKSPVRRIQQGQRSTFYCPACQH